MNYGELLYKAHENHKNTSFKNVPCYKTGFSAPKKMERSTVSSENIKRFLAKKEEEERKKLLEAKRKREELLALRSQDKKAQKRVQVMLKRTKSANKSVMEDAVDNMNTRDTLDGPMQCDEDDYGYVSQEASAFYLKMMNKYENMPAESSNFSKSKREVKDLNAAKDRVKAALRKEEDEAELPHKRKRKKTGEDSEVKKTECDNKDTDKRHGSNDKHKPTSDKNRERDKDSESSKDDKKKKRKPNPPPLDFMELLRLAEVKQHQPVVIDTSNVVKEPERLMTQKEKEEFLKEEERKRTGGKRPSIPSDISSKPNSLSNNKKTLNPKSQAEADKKTAIKSKPTIDKSSDVSKTSLSKKETAPPRKSSSILKDALVHSSASKDKDKMRTENINQAIKNKTASKNIPNKSVGKPVDSSLIDIDREIELLKRKRMQLAAANNNNTASPEPRKQPSDMKYSTNGNKPPLKNMNGKPRMLKPGQMMNSRKPVEKNKMSKRRIDSDSEHDSELDDFIDDGPEDCEDYSKYISEIFRYDKNRYAHLEDEDDECMESNFAQQMKEEFISTKIGIMEDLEDIKKEQEEKKRMKERLKKKSVK